MMLLLIVAWLAAMIACEVVLSGAKVQSALFRVLAVYCLIGAGLVVFAILRGPIGPIAVFIFWSGCFLSWFGVRSHLESSILLRMLFLLKQRARTFTELYAEYESHYGEKARFEELVRARLTGPETATALTAKGKTIVRIVTLLNRNFPA